MTFGGGRWRLLGLAGAAAAALLPLLAARRGTARVERALAARMATGAAGYLATVTPATRPGSATLDTGALLTIARGLAAVPGWTTGFEVYAATAPLLGAGTALRVSDLNRLARREAVEWTGTVARAPLKDRDSWEVGGAVAVRPPRAPGGDRLPVVALLVAAAGAAAALDAGSRRRRRLLWGAFTTAALLHGVLAGRAVQHAAAWGTDRWLAAARVLVREGAARGGAPSLMLQGTATTVAGSDSGGAAVRRVGTAEGARAVAAARLAPGQWVALAALPGERLTGGWYALAVGLAGVGIALAVIAAWGEAARRRPRHLRETLAAWAFLAPAAVPLALFAFAPVAFAAWLSLHRWSLLEPIKPFVGFANFAAVARDPLTWISLRNTAVYALYVPVTMVLALGVAMALNRRGRWVAWVRVAFFLPYVSSVVAVTLVWQWMLHPDFGLLNWLLGTVGVPAVNWLGDRRTALLAVMLVSVWVQIGYQMTVFLAGLQGIPQSYLDAARVDGASAWQRFWRVTFPLLRPVTLFVLVTGVIGSFQVFTYVYVLTEGGPLHATDVLVYRIYQTAWEFLRFGEASALSLGLFALLAGITWLQFRLLGREVEHG